MVVVKNIIYLIFFLEGRVILVPYTQHLAVLIHRPTTSKGKIGISKCWEMLEKYFINVGKVLYFTQVSSDRLPNDISLCHQLLPERMKPQRAPKTKLGSFIPWFLVSWSNHSSNSKIQLCPKSQGQLGHFLLTATKSQIMAHHFWISAFLVDYKLSHGFKMMHTYTYEMHTWRLAWWI